MGSKKLFRCILSLSQKKKKKPVKEREKVKERNCEEIICSRDYDVMVGGLNHKS